MKKLLLILALLSGGAAQAASSWVQESEKTVHFAPKPLLVVTNSEVRGDDSNWYMLTIELKYDYNFSAKQAAFIKRRYPGYRVNRVVINKGGTYHLQIPGLKVDEEIDPMPGVDGPYFSHTIFVAKKDGAMLEKGLKDISSFLTLTGNFSANIPVEKLLEHAELDASICEEFSQAGQDLYSAILGYAKVDQKINVSAQKEETRRKMRDLVLRSCLEMTEPAEIESFSQLLKLPIRRLQSQGNFIIDLKQTVLEKQVVPLEFEATTEGN